MFYEGFEKHNETHFMQHINKKMTDINSEKVTH